MSKTIPCCPAKECPYYGEPLTTHGLAGGTKQWYCGDPYEDWDHSKPGHFVFQPLELTTDELTKPWLVPTIN